MNRNNKELADYCGSLEMDLQKQHKLSEEWQTFGKYVQDLMKQVFINI